MVSASSWRGLTVAIVAALLLHTAAAARASAIPVAPVAWKTQVPNASYGNPFVYDQYLIVAGNFEACGGTGSGSVNQAQNFLYVFERFTGRVIWSAAFDTCGVFVTAGDGIVFVGAYYPTATVRAYEIQTGNLDWTYELPNSYLRADLGGASLGKPAFYAGRVYVTWYTSPMVVLDGQTGAVLAITDYTVGGRIYISELRGVANFIIAGKTATPMYAVAQADITAAVPVLQWSTNISTVFSSLIADDYVATVLTGPSNPNITNVQLLQGYDLSTGALAFTNTYTDPSPANTNFDYNAAIGGTYGTYQNTNTSSVVFRVDSKGKQLWATQYDSTDSSINLASGDRSVFVLAPATNTMWGFDAVTGKALWTAWANNPSFGHGSDGYYYYPENHAIVALRSRF